VNKGNFIKIRIILVMVADYIKTFKWEDNKYPRARSLIELSGMIMEVYNLI
jgi:hypothetical protein